MTGDASSPESRTPSETPLASERDELLARVSAAQTGLAAQLAALMNVAADGNAATLSQELRAQLGGLSALREAISFASPADLARMQMDIAATVAAAQTLAQTASSSLSSDSSAPLSAADYQRKTAELDRRAAVLMADDKAHDDDAHAIARRYGIDLSQQDKEREELERQRQAAHACGDKVAERRLDVQIAQNTQIAQTIVKASATDPVDQKRLANDIAAQNVTIQSLQQAAREQEQLDLAFAQTRPTQQTAQSANVSGDKPVTASSVAMALTPDAKAETQKVAAVIAARFDAALSGISLDMPSTIALSTAPDAHARIETPAASAPAASAPKGQSLA